MKLKDRALGEYLVYNCSRTDENKLPYEMAVAENGKFYLNTQKGCYRRKSLSGKKRCADS